ncbi:hypothetical protein [Porphyromonas pogonae]|uniref:helix-turn-helix and ligand-binding sensor domain-containing protein n=1 Tax=Porphyromonas pogonae TaxID=867595 RepID=UPI002E7AAAE0|nr:hypothetical protein [Porphyromonas pogonae]
MGSFEELGFFEKNGQNILVYHSLKRMIKNYRFQNDEVWTIHKVDGNIYFQTFSSYFVYNEKASTISHSKPFPAPLYFFTYNHKLYSQFIQDDFYELDHNVFKRLLARKQLHNDYIVALLPHDKDLLLVTSKNGILLYKPHTQSVSQWATSADMELKAATANRAIYHADSLYIIGTLKNGVFAIGKDGALKWHLNIRNGLHNNTVLGLYEDRDKNIWAALDNGISNIQTNSNIYLFEPSNVHIGLVEDILTYNNKLYAATNQGIYTYDPIQKNMYRLPEFDSQSWFVKRFGNQIITGNNIGTSFIVNDRNTPLKDVCTGGMDIKHSIINNQEVLLESTYTYLSLYRKNANGQWQYSNQIQGFYDLVNQIETDHMGNVWAGHMYKGVYKLRFDDKLTKVTEVKYFSIQDSVQKIASPVHVMKLRGRVIFSSGNRFYTYDDLNRRIIPYDQLNKDFPDAGNVHRIVSVSDTSFWFVRDNEYTFVSYSQQANKYKVQLRIPFSILNFPPSSGRGNVFVSEKGVSYLALNNGIAQFTPTNFHHRPNDTLRINTIWTYNRKKDKQDLMPVQEGLAIKYQNNNITFKFRYPDFSRRALVIESYLEGYDLRWNAMPKGLAVSYDNLPAGSYNLKARIIDDIGNELSSLSFAFSINKPWYKTDFAIVVYILLFWGGVLLFTRLYSQQIIEKKRKFYVQQEEERRQQLEKQERIITQLKNEKLETELVYKGKELASASMNLINHKEFLNLLKKEIQTNILSGRINRIEGNKLVKLINESMSGEDEWAIFQENFDLIHENFFRKLHHQYPLLTPTDMKLCALLRLNYTSKDIAKMLNLTTRGVEAARYRLRKKLHLPEDINLVSFMIEFK